MDTIIRYYEDLFDNLPKTANAKRIRKRLLSNSIDQYDALIMLAIPEKEALDMTISSIPPYQEIIKYVPVTLYDTSFMYTIICAVMFIISLIVTSGDQFLQIFYPVMFDFPIIIRNTMLYITFTFTSLFALQQWYKFRITSQTNENYKLQVTLKILVLILASVYICSALVFCFYTLCGYPLASMQKDFLFELLYLVYRYIISSTPITLLFGLLTATIYVFSQENPQESMEFLTNDDDTIDAFQKVYIEESIKSVFMGRNASEQQQLKKDTPTSTKEDVPIKNEDATTENRDDSITEETTSQPIGLKEVDDSDSLDELIDTIKDTPPLEGSNINPVIIEETSIEEIIDENKENN